jgi:hypothetical protein
MKYLVQFLLILSFSCTNYSVSKSKIVPPILVSISSISGVAGGYQIKMRVTNQEPFFAGYRIYVGANDNAARNPSDLNSGYGCASGPSIIPNQPIEYVLEVATDAATLPSTSNRLCSYSATLTTGQFISVRTLLVSIQPSNQGGNRINPSLPSNTLVVP